MNLEQLISNPTHIHEKTKVLKLYYPVPKNANYSDVQNYRPISLLCILSIVLELIIYDKLAHFIYPLHSANLFGFCQAAPFLSQLLFSVTPNNEKICLMYYTCSSKKPLVPFPVQNLYTNCGVMAYLAVYGIGFRCTCQKCFHLVSIEGYLSNYFLFNQECHR